MMKKDNRKIEIRVLEQHGSATATLQSCCIHTYIQYIHT